MASAETTWQRSTAGTWNWTDGGNWIGGEAPGNPATDSVFIRPSNNTLLLNTPGDQTIGNGMMIFAAAGYTGELQFDLNTRRLIIDGADLVLDGSYSPPVNDIKVATFTNGTVQLGTEENAASLVLGKEEGRNNFDHHLILTFGTGSTLDSVNLEDLTIASDAFYRARYFTLDLTAASLRSGATEKSLAVQRDLMVGESDGLNGLADRNREGVLSLGELSSFSVGRDFVVGQNQRPGTGNNVPFLTNGIVSWLEGTEEAVTFTVGRDFRLGVGDRSTGSVTNAPEVLHLTIGSAATTEPERGVLYVGYKNQSQGSTDPDGDTAGSFSGGTVGGTFNAWVRELRVGENTRSGGSATGELDLRHLVTGTLMVSGEAVIGKGVGGEGTLYLQGGQAASMDLIVGDATGAGRSLLSLEGTGWSVGETLQVGPLGEIRIGVVANVIGLDLASSDPFDFSIATGGVIDARFDVEAGDEPYWALRMAGDQQSLFETYLINGQLMGSGLFGDSADIWYDGAYTYYGVAVPEPGIFGLALLPGAWLVARRLRKNRSPVWK